MSMRLQAGTRTAPNVSTTNFQPTSGRKSTEHLTNFTQPSRQIPTSGRTSTDHLTSFTQPSRQVPTRVGNVATQSFMTRNPESATVFRSDFPTVIARQEPTVVISGTPRSKQRTVVVVKDRDNCWAKFVAFLALIFCCGLLSKPYRG